MKFAEIIREAGINPADVPTLSEVPIILYDRKHREITDETIHFVDPLFVKNPHARANFLNLCVYLERQLRSGEILPSAFHPTVQVEDTALLVKYDPASSYVFLRHS